MKQLFLFLALAILVISSSCRKTPDGVAGCTDPSSVTYDPEATDNDNSCKYVQKEQKSLIMLFTATWCNVCGQKGEPGFNQGVRLTKNNAVPITVHFSPSDPLHNKTAADLTAYPGFKSSSPPWYTEGSKIIFNGAYSDTNYTAKQIQLKVNATVGKPVTAGTVVKKTIEGNKVRALVGTKFFEKAEGEYTLSVFVMEDGVIASQVEGSELHNHVLRGAMTPAFGETIATGSISMEKQIVKNYELNLGTGWNASKIQVAAVLWKKEADGTYTFINCNMD